MDSFMQSGTQAGPPFEPPFTVADRYVMNDVLGEGGTALVFDGRDNVLERPVALKALRPHLANNPVEARRFLRAAHLSSQLQHENIVVIHDCGEDRERGLVFVVMERLRGETLAALQSKVTRLAWQRVVPILIQICRALEESHRHGILHRDLGLRNVTLIATSSRSDVVKLCDFGLACSSAGDDRVTSTGTAVGTPAYMAPEQIRGDDALDHRLDLYGLGVIAYELLSGRLPHEASNSVAMIASKLAAPAVPLSERCPELELPTGLESLIMRCLASEPGDRPNSAAEIEAELMKIDAALDDADPQPAPRRLSRWLGLLIVAVCGIGGSALALQYREDERPRNPTPVDPTTQTTPVVTPPVPTAAPPPPTASSDVPVKSASPKQKPRPPRPRPVDKQPQPQQIQIVDPFHTDVEIVDPFK